MTGAERYQLYKQDADHVTYGIYSDKKVLATGPAGFEVTAPSSPYARDGKNVYCDGEVLSSAARDTFIVLRATFSSDSYTHSYAKDTGQVYYLCNSIPQADPLTFQPICKDIESPISGAVYNSCVTSPLSLEDFDAQDKNHKYYQGQIAENRIFSWIPISSTQALSSIETEPWTNNYESYIEFPNADPKSLVIASYKYGTSTIYTHYVKDKSYVYYIAKRVFEEVQVKKIEGADAQTFEPIFNSRGLAIESRNFAKDKNHVYYEENKIVGADIFSFRPAFDTSFAPPWPTSNGLEVGLRLPDSTDLEYYDAEDKNYKYHHGKVVE